MTRPGIKNLRAKSQRVAEELAADLDSLSDEQILREASEDGIDSVKLADNFRSSAANLIAAAKRQRLVQARHKLDAYERGHASRPASRPSLEVIKERIQAVLVNRPSLAIAFRDGRSHPDSDWLSLWDNFMELGVVKDDDDDQR